MAEITKRRSGELLCGVLEILKKNPDGLQAQKVLSQLETQVPPTEFENGCYASRPDVRRYEKIVRFATIGPVKAGWLEKNKGTWSITEEGRRVLRDIPDSEALMREADRLYRKWRADQPDEPAEEGDTPEETATIIEEAEESAWSEIEEELVKTNPYDFQDMVAGLLRGMGYFVDWISPPGPDKGIDIVAHSDPLGVEGPRIKVQVKRQANRQAVDAIRGFLAVLGDTDVGIFVSTGGFTKDAEIEARGQERRRIMLLDLKKFFDLWVEHYENIPEKQRRLLPLRPVYYLAPDD